MGGLGGDRVLIVLRHRQQQEEEEEEAEDVVVGVDVEEPPAPPLEGQVEEEEQEEEQEEEPHLRLVEDALLPVALEGARLLHEVVAGLLGEITTALVAAVETDQVEVLEHARAIATRLQPNERDENVLNGETVTLAEVEVLEQESGEEGEGNHLHRHRHHPFLTSEDTDDRNTSLFQALWRLLALCRR